MEDFVPFELAKKLKEKGFDGKVSAYYKNTNKIFNTGNASNLNILTGVYSAPTISQVLKWLREEKKIHITIDLLPSGYYAMIYIGISDENNSFNWRDFYDDLNIYETYELAAIAGVEYCLDNLI